MLKYSQHPLGMRLPPMSATEFERLCGDIKKNGLKHRITLYEGKVLDGMNRYRACDKVGERPQFIEYRGKNPVGFVLTENVIRRHLTESQCAMYVVEANEWLAEGRPKTTSRDVVSAKKSGAELATEAGVSVSTIERAKTVAAEGSEELKEMVREGEVSVKEAAKIATTVAEKDQAKVASGELAPPDPSEQKPATTAKKGKPTTAAKKEKPPTVPQKLYDELVAEHQKALEEYAALEENRNALAYEVEAMQDLKDDEHVKKFKEAKLEIASLKRALDDAMNKAVEAQKQSDFWMKAAKGLGWTTDLIKTKPKARR